ncbi:hypothetical protein AMAG_11668 [Allomyces macrogynus ATCC 38327]|uniref:RRM domain-containing protein n=1 Tax=Allomyces macrogynus (strain ATCC 38327) TaxID=578462 RepID=A0A0L0SVD7_ALLM3|nr:hypothetical protein AMAG_11668 [Allomyces macrogynus ATCC 38327]|eukprot:KNE66538.1 hypothetical protein AMAG_11668 [Allomyces macrogynus ATCC 38327]
MADSGRLRQVRRGGCARGGRGRAAHGVVVATVKGLQQQQQQQQQQQRSGDALPARAQLPPTCGDRPQHGALALELQKPQPQSLPVPRECPIPPPLPQVALTAPPVAFSLPVAVLFAVAPAAQMVAFTFSLAISASVPLTVSLPVAVPVSLTQSVTASVAPHAHAVPFAVEVAVPQPCTQYQPWPAPTVPLPIAIAVVVACTSTGARHLASVATPFALTPVPAAVSISAFQASLALAPLAIAVPVAPAAPPVLVAIPITSLVLPVAHATAHAQPLAFATQIAVTTPTPFRGPPSSLAAAARAKERRPVAPTTAPRRWSIAVSAPPFPTRSPMPVPPMSAQADQDVIGAAKCKVVVRNMTQATRFVHVREIFGYFGSVTNVELLTTSHRNGTHGTTMCVTYASPTAASDAIAHMDGGEIDGAAPVAISGTPWCAVPEPTDGAAAPAQVAAWREMVAARVAVATTPSNVHFTVPAAESPDVDVAVSATQSSHVHFALSVPIAVSFPVSVARTWTPARGPATRQVGVAAGSVAESLAVALVLAAWQVAVAVVFASWEIPIA